MRPSIKNNPLGILLSVLRSPFQLKLMCTNMISLLSVDYKLVTKGAIIIDTQGWFLTRMCCNVFLCFFVKIHKAWFDVEIGCVFKCTSAFCHMCGNASDHWYINYTWKDFLKTQAKTCKWDIRRHKSRITPLTPNPHPQCTNVIYFINWLNGDLHQQCLRCVSWWIITSQGKSRMWLFI